MLFKIALFASLVSLSATAQTAKDFTLVTDLNPWLTSNSGAALTTFADSSATRVGVRLAPLAADVQGYYRLSPRAVASGAISYSYDSDGDYSGSAFTASDELHPFDIVIQTPGRLVSEQISLSGAVGWQASKSLSVGARLDYSVGNTARQKDLRFSNFRMDLAASLGIFHAPASRSGGGAVGWGASLFYRRTTEDVAFSRAGTTDLVHTALIEYANGIGVTETYSGDGFTDDSEQPLFTDYKGASAQLSLPLPASMSLFVDALYARRAGYYGRESQYTLKHATHRSHLYDLHARLSLPAVGDVRPLRHFLDARLAVENLVAFRTNYLSEIHDGVTSYTYYQPVKTANKVQASLRFLYAAHLQSWRLSLGARLLYRKQTAWLYPQTSTETTGRFTPFLTLQRTFPLNLSSIAKRSGANSSNLPAAAKRSGAKGGCLPALLVPRVAVSTSSVHFEASLNF